MHTYTNNDLLVLFLGDFNCYVLSVNSLSAFSLIYNLSQSLLANL